MIDYSICESDLWLESEHFNFRVGEAFQYVVENSTLDESAVAFFQKSFFSFGMMRFYLEILDSEQRRLIEFPKNAVDVYTSLPNDQRFFFSLNKLIQHFEVMNMKYL